MMLTKLFFSSSKLCCLQSSKQGHKNKKEFDCVQRAHQNTLESAPSVAAQTMMVGLMHPVGGGVVRNLVRRESRVRRRIRNGQSGESPTRRDGCASRRHTVVRDDVRRRV